MVFSDDLNSGSMLFYNRCAIANRISYSLPERETPSGKYEKQNFLFFTATAKTLLCIYENIQSGIRSVFGYLSSRSEYNIVSR